MALLAAFSATDKTTHNSNKFAFKLSLTNYWYWKAMIEPFLITNNLFSYVDGSIPCPPKTIQSSSSSRKDKDDTVLSPPQPNPNYSIWVSNDAYVRMLITSTVSEASFKQVQGNSSREIWLSFERAYAPHTTSREYTLKTQLLKLQMKSDETSSAYLTRAQEYGDALANIGEPVKEKDLVILVISGLRDDYNGLKSNLLGRQFPTAFNELYGLLSDHEYMIQKSTPDPATVQAFTAVTSSRNLHISGGSSSVHSDNMQALQQLVAQLGLQLQPALQHSSGHSSQAFYANRSTNNPGQGQYNRREGRGNNNNRNPGGGNRSQFSWASTQNTVYGTCNRCSIGHVPSQCPNRDPATLRTRQPSANYADYCSQASFT